MMTILTFGKGSDRRDYYLCRVVTQLTFDPFVLTLAKLNINKKPEIAKIH